MAAYFGSNPSQRASSSSAAGGRNTHRPALQPVLFCGPGTNLYPLCEAPSLSPSGQPQAALPKALLPVANRPLISYPLQWLLSAGLRNAIILAPTSSHSQISAALRSLHLHLPPGAPASATTSAGAPNVFVGDAASVNAPSSGARDAAMRVELLPLGPDAEEAVKEDDAEEGFEGVPVLGTADLLRWLAREGKLEADPLILPVDLLAPYLPLRVLTDAHLAAVPDPPTLFALMYERGAGEGTGKERERDGPPKVFTAYDTASELPTQADVGGKELDQAHTSAHRLLWVRDADDIEDEVELRMSMLWKHPHARLSTSLLDAHVYILNLRSVLPLLEAHPEITSIREHLIPFLVKCAWQTGLREKVGWLPEQSQSVSTPDRTDPRTPGGTTVQRNDQSLARSTTYLAPHLSSAGSPAPGTPAAPLTPDVSHPPSPRTAGNSLHAQAGSKEAQRASAALVRCVALVHRLIPPQTTEEVEEEPDQRFVARANTIPTYFESNRFALRSLAAGSAGSLLAPNAPGSGTLSPPEIPSPPPTASSGTTTPLIDPRAQISNDTLVGADTRIGERAALKRCVVGRECTIARGARLTGCVVMDGVTVGENAKLENCILCVRSRVGERVTLKDCDVGPGYAVLADTSTKNEKLVSNIDDE